MSNETTPAMGTTEVSTADEFAAFEALRNKGEFPDLKTEEKSSEAVGEEAPDSKKAETAPESAPEDKQETKHEEGGDEDADTPDEGEKAASKKPRWRRDIDQLREDRRELRQRVDLLERQLAEPKAATPAKAREEDAEPNLESFDSLQEYLDKRDAWKENQRVKAEQQQVVQRENEAWYEKCQEARDKREDFDDAVSRLRITPVVNAILRAPETEAGAEIAYYLATNPEEAKRINALGPVAASRELFKIESKFAEPQKQSPAHQKTQASAAPEPIKPISGVKGGSSHDPYGLENGDFAKFEKQRLREERGA